MENPDSHTPNERLRDLLKEAQWTGDALAKSINALGAENGLSLHYRRPSVAQWLAGSVPRPPVPQLITEAFSRRLGRLVTAEDAGLSKTRQTLSVRPSQVALQLAWLGDQQPETGGSHIYSMPLLESLIEALSSNEAIPPRPENADRRIGASEISAATAALSLFSSAEQIFGGGRIRPAISTYLATTIAPWLQRPSSPTINRRLLSLAASMSYLSAFSHYDDQNNGTAQRYYACSLQLALAANDTASIALSLRGISVQAHALGHRRKALQAAEAAQQHSRNGAPLLRAAIFGQQAVTAASVGDARQAAAYLLAAEHYLNQASAASEPVGVYHLSSFAHQQAEAAALLGDYGPAEAALHEAIRRRPPIERRSHILTLHKLADLQLAQGNLEAACATWQDFLKGYPYITSGRVDAAYSTMRARLKPFKNFPKVDSILRQPTC
ncbi:hypothetical protein [Streptomyces sp. MS2.AVA.5]|uniref:Uncharacterized protein n=1 Tax=Streptomyces achmelvichensis TaxID=3134111 RepID=A0ACC6Q8Y9_9ACTN